MPKIVMPLDLIATRSEIDAIYSRKNRILDTASGAIPVIAPPTPEAVNHVAMYEIPLVAPAGARVIRMTVANESIPIDYDPATRTCYPVLKN